jgi:hypothetical protein
MFARPIRMSTEAFASFVEELAKPPRVVPQIVELMKRKAPWEHGYIAGASSDREQAPRTKDPSSEDRP